MRNRYTKDFENFVKENACKYKREDLRQLVQDKFNLKVSKDAFRRYLNRHKIKTIHNIKNNIRDVYKAPIETEKITKHGVFIKVAQPSMWCRKSRIMYEKYNNCKLNDNDYIIFLNGDNNDFSKDNLVKCSKREIMYMHNCKTFSKNADLTKLALLTAKLYYKSKEVSKNEKD